MVFGMETRAALRVFGFCGLASVLVDVDHGLSLLLWRFVNPQITEGRLWHTPLLIVVCIIMCYLVSHCRGLRPKLFLGTVLTTTILILLFSPYVVWTWTR